MNQPTASIHRRLLPNIWDLLVLLIAVGVLVALADGAREAIHESLAQLEQAPLSLDPWQLPEYALRTTLRMLIALALSLLFTLIYGTLAAKSRRAELLLVPTLDILQSVPILGFLSFTVAGFLALFPGQALGAECAAIFAIFTSQAWNMTFSFYQSLRGVPRDLIEVSKGFQLSAWQRFWRLEVPYATPSLVWNMMMSMSGGWFFVVAAEAITVGNQTLTLPGIGSYVAAAIVQKDLSAIAWALLAMLVVIVAYDQLLFRPIVAWADKFRLDQTAGQDSPRSWLLEWMRRTRAVATLLSPLRKGWLWARTRRLDVRAERLPLPVISVQTNRWIDRLWLVAVLAGALYSLWAIVAYASMTLALGDAFTALGFGFITFARVLLLVALTSLVWVPIGVWIGLHPRWADRVQPVAQFLAAFPANLMFPVAVVGIVHFNAQPDIWLSPLMVLGTQWYILFNVIAGARAIPNDLLEAAANLRLSRWLWWRKFILPAIFPAYLTGAVTATGGSWNASIVAEYVSWGNTQLTAHGLGAYIAKATEAGDFPRIVLGVTTMSMFVILCNRLLWRPLYRYAEQRLRID